MKGNGKLAIDIGHSGIGVCRNVDSMTQVETISNRVEVMSRGFNGNENDIADLLTSVGGPARGIDKNMKILNMISTMLASVGMAVAAFVKTRISTTDDKDTVAADDTEVPP